MHSGGHGTPAPPGAYSPPNSYFCPLNSVCTLWCHAISVAITAVAALVNTNQVSLPPEASEPMYWLKLNWTPEDSRNETKPRNVCPGCSTHNGVYFLTIPSELGLQHICPVSGVTKVV